MTPPRYSSYSDFGPLVIPDDSIEDDKVLFLTDILPTGWMAAENADIEPGDTVAVWGCGPVGLFAVQSAFLMGAERVIAIDHFPHRLELAKRFGAETINFEESAVAAALLLRRCFCGFGGFPLLQHSRHGHAPLQTTQA